MTVNATDPRKRFPRSARVRTRAEYSTVFDGARRVSDPLMTVHWLRGDAPARLGLAVSRKVDGRAVGRNRIKRVLRDATRHLRQQMVGGDFVVVVRSAARTASNEQIRQSLERLLRRLGALQAPALAAAAGSADDLPMNAPAHTPG